MIGRRARCAQPAGALVAIVVLLLAIGPVVRAVDDEVVQQREQQADESESNLHPLDQQFDQIVFGNQPGWMGDGRQDGEQQVAGGRDVLAAAGRVADRRLASIARACGLSRSQTRALRLAMESDIRRMADVVERERAKYEGVVVDFNDPAGQRRLNLLQQDASRARERVKGLFESDSLFRKAIGTVLDESQAGKLAGSRDRQRTLLWKSLVLTVMLDLDDRLGLDQAQSDAIERLLLEKVPALRVDPVPAEIEQQHMQQMIVFAMLAQADQQRLKAAVSPRQWRVLSQHVQGGRGNMAMLRAQGLLEKSDK